MAISGGLQPELLFPENAGLGRASSLGPGLARAIWDSGSVSTMLQQIKVICKSPGPSDSRANLSHFPSCQAGRSGFVIKSPQQTK